MVCATTLRETIAVGLSTLESDATAILE